MTNWRTQFIEAWMFFGVPGVAALLPWALAWRWLRWWARRGNGPFAEASNAAVAVAPKHLAIGDEKTFAERMRLVWMLDYADLLLSVSRLRRAWRPWHVRQVGEWPHEGAFIAAGFHHGTCYWVFKSLAAAGRDSTFVSARWERSDYAKFPFRYWHGRLRAWDMARLGRRPVAYRPGVKAALDATLSAGAIVVGLVDLPPRTAPRGQRPVHLLDLELSLPDGLLAVAREAGVPVVPYWSEFDADLYTRSFHIGAPLDAANTDATLQTLADILDRQIRHWPEAWLSWPELPQWTVDAAQAAARDGACAP